MTSQPNLPSQPDQGPPEDPGPCVGRPSAAASRCRLTAILGLSVLGTSAGVLSSLMLAGTAAIVLAGCGSEPEPPPPPPVRPQREEAPPPPTVESVDSIIRQRGLSDKLVLADEHAPASTAERVAILEFFDAFARSDDRGLAEMLTPLDEQELRSMVESGVWAASTSKIELIELRTGAGPDGQSCVLAIFLVDGVDQPQLWYYSVEGGVPEFESVACPPGLMKKLYGEDLITLWHKLIDEERMLASLPDEDVTIRQVDLSSESDDGSFGSGGSTPAGAPSPGGPGGRRPVPPPRAPPGPAAPRPSGGL